MRSLQSIPVNAFPAVPLPAMDPTLIDGADVRAGPGGKRSLSGKARLTGSVALRRGRIGP
ncbi:hypothetical protein GCM10009830_43170 [Glycomyces endophyticus]|uniref:Uncharacterized protein n=1 Tax=Glycomyces endophyticus TaxID=480996 RepID=A0ABN2HNK5_9ACTN